MMFTLLLACWPLLLVQGYRYYVSSCPPGTTWAWSSGSWRCVTVISGATTTTPAPMTFPDPRLLLYNRWQTQVKVWYCDNLSYGLGSNSRMVMALPGDPMWNYPGNCSYTIDMQPCPGPAPFPAGAQVVQNFTWNSTTVYGVYYECNDGLQMLSDYPGRLTQCVAGRWTDIFDVCVDAYCVPRDCCLIAGLNKTNNDSQHYMIAPSAYRDNNTTMVMCDLGKTVRDKEGGWTLVLNNSMTDSSTLNMTLNDYVRGAGDFLSTSYFIGLWTLTALNWDGDTERPLVMKIMMTNGSGKVLHATYGRLVVSWDNYTLVSVGPYQGNAGDHLTGSVGNTFCPDRDSNIKNPCWWGNSSTPNSGLLTGAAPTWGSISLTSVTVWVRPLACDQELACPPLNTSINLANESDVPVSRAPGTSFQYTCPGDLMMNGVLGSSSQSPQGTVTCLRNTAVGNPTWDTVFPCHLVCPSDYVMSVNRSTCYYFSSGNAAKGHTDALTKCALKNSSLAFINDPRDMSTANNNTFYLTAYTLTRDVKIFPYLRTWEDHGFTCTQRYSWCPTGGQERCFILHRAGYFNVTDCQTDNKFICQRPATCPPGYTLYKSRCYKLLQPGPNTTFLDALHTCNYDGSALAYPQDLDTLNFLTMFAQQKVNWSTQVSVDVAVGYTNIWEDLTVSGIYSPDTSIQSLVQNLSRAENLNYTFLSVTNSGQRVLTPANINSTITYALCEFRGPLGCWESYPLYENTSVTGILSGNIINQTLKYSCWPGYFVNAEVGNKTTQFLWCHGQLGGWFPRHPPLIPCIGVDVCNETFPPTPPYMKQDLGQHPRYETFSLSYSCNNSDMSNMAGEQKQVLTCTEYNGTYAYNRKNVTACDRCFNRPPLANANTTFASKSVWVIGDQAEATCDPSYQVAHNVSNQLVNCTANGWQMLQCQRVCLGAPNVTNATTDWVDAMWTVGESVEATCLGDLYFRSLKSQTRSVSCTWGGWDNLPICRQVCLGNPVVENATANLQNVMWAVGEAPTATCNSEYMFLPEATNTQPVMCTSQGWENRTGCARVCNQPPIVQSATTDWTSSGVWPVGSTVNGSCNTGTVLVPSGSQQFTVQCTYNGWTTNSCLQVCSGEPQVVNATTTWTSRLWLVGSAVNATCLGNLTFINPRSPTRLVSCTSTGWANSPPCDEVKPSLPCSVKPEVENATTTWDNKTWGVGEVIIATCSFPLYYFNDSTQQLQLECTKDGWQNVTGCSKVASEACSQDAPEVNNTNSTWVARNWYVGENVTVTCLPDHWFITEDTDHLLVNCTWDGWTSLTGCTEVEIGEKCSVAPLVENANTTWMNRTWLVGYNVTATCWPGFVFVAANASQSSVTCTDQGWQNLTGCEIVCEDEPSVGGAETDWSSTVLWPLGATVNATCLHRHYVISDGNQTQTVECTNQGWQNVTPCEPGCAEQPANESTNGSAIWQWESRVWMLDENLTASCADHYLTHDGTNTTAFTCTQTGWIILAPCVKVCEGEPRVDNASTTWVSGLWLEGQVVTAQCKPQYRFQDQVFTLTLACTDTGWQNTTGCTFFFTCLVVPW